MLFGLFRTRGHGLYLQVNTTGSRSWVFSYTKDKKTREMGLG
ncbi:MULTISPECIES: Arm DNA-binding domain-containing protein [Polaromonas]|uniref:Arm DNA-binding domain-containing protein n=1 Tax=Polaromonas aquatica TaxID=332657 RepID=A0ABW1TR80_9BURK